MSLFQIKEIWKTRVDTIEDSFYNCLIIGGDEKIYVGSENGLIRIFKPSKGRFTAEDLLIEHDVGQPIQKILLGRFKSTDCSICIALLHPNKISVYELLSSDDFNVNYSLRMSYENILEYGGKSLKANNAISGCFGRSNTKDSILVQSISDGKFVIFEQNTPVCTFQCSNSFLPHPILYHPSIDSFIIGNDSYHIDCYSFKTLISNQSSVAEWTFNFGESLCLDIVYGNISNNNNDKQIFEILLLTEQYIYLVSSYGTLIHQRRLERSPCRIREYVVSASDENWKHNFIIGYQDYSLEVFSQFQLIWAAKLSFIPMHIEVGSMWGHHGLLTLLGDSGDIVIGCLGTKPTIQHQLEDRTESHNVTKIEREFREFMRTIEQSQTVTRSDVSPSQNLEKLLMTAQVANIFDFDSFPNTVTTESTVSIGSFYDQFDTKLSEHQLKVCVRIYIALNGTSDTNGNTDVHVTVSTPMCILASPTNFSVRKRSSKKSTPVMVKVYLYALRTFLPSDHSIQLTATYISPLTGEPQLTVCKVPIPLFMFCCPKAPKKDATYKMTIETKHQAVPLDELFHDFLSVFQSLGIDINSQLADTSTKALGFQMWSSGSEDLAHTTAHVSVIVSKSAGRYRVQSDDIAAIYIIMTELNRRLQLSIAATAAQTSSQLSSAEVFSNDPLPLDIYFNLIQTHKDLRNQLNIKYTLLEKLSHQFWAIQKHLIQNYKLSNPNLLASLESILKETYDEIMSSSDHIELCRLRKKKKYIQIFCVSKLLILLLKLRYKTPAADLELLDAYLCPSDDLFEFEDHGWEDRLILSMEYLLKLLCPDGDDSVANAKVLPHNQLENVPLIESFKQLFLMVVERLTKGIRLTVDENIMTSECN